MFTRRICSLFACSAVALLLLVFCTGDSALSGNGQALPILMYHDVVEDGQPYNTWTVTAGRFRQDLQWLKDHGYACVLPREPVSYTHLVTSFHTVVHVHSHSAGK